MDFNLSPADVEWRDRVKAFIDTDVRPRAADYVAQQAEGDRWKVLPVIEELKAKARAEGLWNLFMPDERFGPGLSNWEYGLLCEEMGIRTGIDLDKLIEVGRMAEEIVGHQLPSELIHAGSLDAFRRKAA